MNWESLPQQARGQLSELNETLIQHLEALANRLDGQPEATAMFDTSAMLSVLNKDLNIQLQQSPTQTAALLQLQDHCTLYRELLAALTRLEQELSTLTLSLSLPGRGQYERSEYG
jgi:hypothetical protein